MELENFKYNLSNLKKCDQFWDEMSSVIGGRHCKKCNKKIIDFSDMTFTDIAIFMSESKEPVCGFYLPEQREKINRSKNKLPIAIGLSTLIATTSISKNKEINIQTFIQTSIKDQIKLSNIKNGIHNQNSKNDTAILIGRVQYYDSTKKTNQPLPYATVMIKEERLGTLTTDSGDFKIGYILPIGREKVHVVISSVGYESKEIPIDFNDKEQIDLGIISLTSLKNEVTQFYVTVKKRSKLHKFWRKLTKPFRNN